MEVIRYIPNPKHQHEINPKLLPINPIQTDEVFLDLFEVLPFCPIIPRDKKNTDDEDSALIQDLDNACNIGLKGWNNYVTQSRSGRARTDQQMEENVDDFLKRSVELIAFEIKETIDGLTRVDGYPKHMWGDYEEIYEKIEGEQNVHERAKLFRKLIIRAKTIIPREVQFVRPKIITPTMGHVSGSDKA